MLSAVSPACHLACLSYAELLLLTMDLNRQKTPTNRHICMPHPGALQGGRTCIHKIKTETFCTFLKRKSCSLCQRWQNAEFAGCCQTWHQCNSFGFADHCARLYIIFTYLLTYNIGAHILICLCQISFLEMTKLTSAEAILTFNCPSYHSFNSVKPSRWPGKFTHWPHHFYHHIDQDQDSENAVSRKQGLKTP